MVRFSCVVALTPHPIFNSHSCHRCLIRVKTPRDLPHILSLDIFNLLGLFISLLSLFPFPFSLDRVDSVMELDHVLLVVVQLLVILEFVCYFLQNLVI